MVVDKNVEEMDVMDECDEKWDCVFSHELNFNMQMKMYAIFKQFSMSDNVFAVNFPFYYFITYCTLFTVYIVC